jgi:hypothetical protein
MRWKLSHHHSHDPRRIDLLAAIVIVVTIITAYVCFTQPEAPSTAAFIVPSQSVRW